MGGHLRERVDGLFESRPLGPRPLPGTTQMMEVFDVVAQRERRVSSADQTASLDQSQANTPPDLNAHGLAAAPAKAT